MIAAAGILVSFSFFSKFLATKLKIANIELAFLNLKSDYILLFLLYWEANF